MNTPIKQKVTITTEFEINGTKTQWDVVLHHDFGRVADIIDRHFNDYDKLRPQHQRLGDEGSGCGSE